MSDDNKLGAYLKAAREDAHLSMGQAATSAKTNKSYIARLESGEMSNPSGDMLMRLAKAYEINAADLFLLADIPLPTERPSLDAMLRADYDLPDEAIAEARAEIEAIVKRYAKGGPEDHPNKQ